MNARRLVPFCVLLAACEHGAPFRSVGYGSDGPLDPGPVARLTFNTGVDAGATWLPPEGGGGGGGGILYTAQRVDRADEDRCFAMMPPGGGAIFRYVCRSTTANDSIDVFDEAAVAGDGRIAYVRSRAHRFPGPPVAPDVQALVVAPLADPNRVRVLETIAYLAPSGHTHQGVSHIRWLSSTRLVYLGEMVTYPRLCQFCVRDTVRTGIEIVTLDLAGATPALAVVPTTDSASSVAIGATSDTIYFTRNGDARVYRYAFSTGQTGTVHDFAVAGIARDVGFANGRLVAVVGGDVSYTVDSLNGPQQVDRGGELHVVTLATGADTVLGDPAFRFRRPAFGPDGTRLTAEVWVSGRADLWLLAVP